MVDAEGALDADGVEQRRHDDALLELLMRQICAGERRQVQVKVVDPGPLLAGLGVGDGLGPRPDAG